MKFKDVAHYYVGCRTVVFWGDTPFYPIMTSRRLEHLDRSEFKPVLFPLSAMTEEQKAERDRLGIEAFNQVSLGSIGQLAKATLNRQVAEINYLLSHHFDLFNLIESNEAIDATTITPNPYTT